MMMKLTRLLPQRKSNATNKTTSNKNKNNKNKRKNMSVSISMNKANSTATAAPPNTSPDRVTPARPTTPLPSKASSGAVSHVAKRSRTARRTSLALASTSGSSSSSSSDSGDDDGFGQQADREVGVKRAQTAPKRQLLFSASSPSSSSSAAASPSSLCCEVCFQSALASATTKCSECGLVTHDTCYQMKDGRCQPCAKKALPVSRFCALCLRQGGALRRTTEHQWVHIACAVFGALPGHAKVSIGEASSMTRVRVKRTGPKKTKQACGVCTRRSGFMVGCDHPDCKTFMHAHCVVQNAGTGIDHTTMLGDNNNSNNNNKNNNNSNNNNNLSANRSADADRARVLVRIGVPPRKSVSCAVLSAHALCARHADLAETDKEWLEDTEATATWAARDNAWAVQDVSTKPKHKLPSLKKAGASNKTSRKKQSKLRSTHKQDKAAAAKKKAMLEEEKRMLSTRVRRAHMLRNIERVICDDPQRLAVFQDAVAACVPLAVPPRTALHPKQKAKQLERKKENALKNKNKKNKQKNGMDMDDDDDDDDSEEEEEEEDSSDESSSEEESSSEDDSSEEESSSSSSEEEEEDSDSDGSSDDGASDDADSDADSDDGEQKEKPWTWQPAKFVPLTRLQLALERQLEQVVEHLRRHLPDGQRWIERMWTTMNSLDDGTLPEPQRFFTYKCTNAGCLKQTVFSSICQWCANRHPVMARPKTDEQWALLNKRRNAAGIRALRFLGRLFKEEDDQEFEYHAGDCIFLLRVPCQMAADDEVRTEANKVTRQLIKRFDRSDIAVLDQYQELEPMLRWTECHFTKKKLGLIEGDELKDAQRRCALALTSHSTEDVVRYDPDVWHGQVPITEHGYCRKCGTFQELRNEVCETCDKPLGTLIDYEHLTECMVWCDVFAGLGVPIITSDGGCRTDQVLALIKDMRPYKSLEELGWGSFLLQSYFVTHLLMTISGWGEAPLGPLRAELFMEEYTFVHANMSVVIEHEDPELVGEFCQALYMLGVKPETDKAYQDGIRYLLKVESRGRFVDDYDSPVYKRYHAAYTGIVGLAPHKLLPGRQMPKQWHHFFDSKSNLKFKAKATTTKKKSK